MRKFRVQFLDCNQKTSQENCNECIEELSRFFKFLPYEETIKTQHTTTSNQSRENDYSNKAPLYSNSYTNNSLSNRMQYYLHKAHLQQIQTQVVVGRRQDLETAKSLPIQIILQFLPNDVRKKMKSH